MYRLPTYRELKKLLLPQGPVEIGLTAGILLAWAVILAVVSLASR